MPSQVRTWALLLRLARFKFLVPGVLLYILGATLAFSAGYPIDLERFIWGYAIFGFAQLSVSFSNDYFDREGDALGKPGPISGGSGILVDNPELAPIALRISLFLLVLSALTAVSFVLEYSAGPAYLAIAILGGWLGFFYSAPPLRLAWNGWGELTTAIAAGLIMPGMGYFTMAGALDLWFLVLSVPLMIYGVFFIVSVEIPDMEADRKAGKVNLVSRRGVATGIKVCLLASMSGTVTLFMIWWSGWLTGKADVLLITMISLIPLAASATGYYLQKIDEANALSSALRNFASLIAFVVLVDIGLLVSI